MWNGNIQGNGEVAATMQNLHKSAFMPHVTEFAIGVYGNEQIVLHIIFMASHTPENYSFAFIVDGY